MKKETKITMTAAALVAVIATAGIAVTSFAYQGSPDVKGPNYTPERHDAMMNAFEEKDYNAWRNARGEDRGRIMDVINEENFSKFVEMHNLRLAGDDDGADKIREELGLDRRRMNHGKNRGLRCDCEKGENRNGNFIDENNDGICDKMQ